MRWLIDGMNVVGARPDGWWHDRPAAMRRLIEQLDEFAAGGDHEVTVVFDGKPFEVERAAVQVAFATARGPNAADHDIAERVESDDDPGTITVVTSDQALADRARTAGAEVMGAGTFRRRLDGTADRGW